MELPWLAACTRLRLPDRRRTNRLHVRCIPPGIRRPAMACLRELPRHHVDILRDGAAGQSAATHVRVAWRLLHYHGRVY